MYRMKRMSAVAGFVALIALLSRSNAVASSSAQVGLEGAALPCIGNVCDTHIRCPFWRDDGECIRSPIYMKQYCPASCHNVKAEELQAGRRDLEQGVCQDRHADCATWASLGECDTNAAMKTYCAVACGLCEAEPAEGEDMSEDPSCVDEHENCAFWAKVGECDKNPNYMKQSCKKSCKTCGKKAVEMQATPLKNMDEKYADIQRQSHDIGVIQNVEGAQQAEVAALIQESIEYMQSDAVLELDESIRAKCQNRHNLCSFWAIIGECQNNPAYMVTNCAPCCKTCHLIDLDKRCPKLKDDVAPALYPGDLNRMFQHIVRHAPGNRTDLSDDERQALIASIEPIYTVHVHSQPDDSTKEISVALDKSSPPWVITLDNFLTDEECEEIIQLGYKHVYERSADVGDEKFDGSHEAVQSERRTSENAWCSTHKGCRAEKVPTRIHSRISAVLNIPPENSEDFQILKYEKGQFYRTHHDFIPHQVERQCGPRILTFFLYLSDVESGGGTNFPQLDLTIEPKRGRALLWPSVLNADPMKKDPRMMHQAMEVLEGTKYAANGWIHMYDYVTPQKNSCT